MSQDMYDIVDESSGDALRLVLRVEGQPIVTAGAQPEVVSQMQAQLGVSREDLISELKRALESLHRNELEKVTIERVRESAPDSRSYVASYIFRDFKNITEGITWYDMPKGTTGPDNVPTLVRNKLRYEVHKKLTAGNASAEALLRSLR